MSGAGTTADALTSMEYLLREHPGVATAFRDGVRAAVDAAGELAPRERELIMLGAYTAARQPRAFAVHCRRALQAGAERGQVHHAVLLTLGASATLEMVVDALQWADEVVAERRGDEGE
jgi:alkylhydroperoxidase/carboxymuconolactone decarboxylase family protein YurZ